MHKAVCGPHQGHIWPKLVMTLMMAETGLILKWDLEWKINLMYVTDQQDSCDEESYPSPCVDNQNLGYFLCYLLRQQLALLYIFFY